MLQLAQLAVSIRFSSGLDLLSSYRTFHSGLLLWASATHAGGRSRTEPFKPFDVPSGLYRALDELVDVLVDRHVGQGVLPRPHLARDRVSEPIPCL